MEGRAFFIGACELFYRKGAKTRSTQRELRFEEVLHLYPTVLLRILQGLKMGELILSEIWIYPIKSLGGIQLSSAKVFEKGLQFDRRWMLVDEANVFMTQRVYPKMALLKQSILENKLTVTKADPNSGVRPSITIDMTKLPLGDTIQSKVWDNNVLVQEVDSNFSDWFSTQLEMRCKLVFFPESNSRPVDEKYRVNDENVGLADAYPFLIIGQSSLDDLNSRLDQKVPMDRFRPNFVFTGGEPYEEETWRNFKVGQNRFVGVKPCARCVLTTVDQVTAIKGTEPLATLSTYRRKETKVLFGQNVVAIDHTSVNVGDPIMVE